MLARNRRLLRVFTRAFGAALLLAACVGPALTTAAAQSPVVLKMARNAEPGVFVPWLIDDNTALFTLANVYDGLLRVTKDGASVEPALATKWETSADGLTWTFTPAPGRQVLRRHAADLERRQGLARSRSRRPANRLEGQLQGHQGNPDARPDDRQDHPDRTARAAAVRAGHVPRLGHAGGYGDGHRRQGLRRHARPGRRRAPARTTPKAGRRATGHPQAQPELLEEHARGRRGATSSTSPTTTPAC